MQTELLMSRLDDVCLGYGHFMSFDSEMGECY
jgi:hypothetical protein